MLICTMLTGFAMAFGSVVAMILILRACKTLISIVRSIFDWLDDHVVYVPKHARKL